MWRRPCSATRSPRTPRQDPEELRRWVAGIARHKVADYHRRARRMVLDDECDGVAAEPPVVARGVLAEVAAAATTDREREALGWLVREHAGEKLSEIALEAGLSGDVVRQRVSRLRRALRARLGPLLVILLAIGAAGALWGTSRPEPIVAEPKPEAFLTPAATQGAWRVVTVQVSGSLTPIEKSVLERELAGASVDVGRETIELVTSTGRVERRNLQSHGSFLFHADAAGKTPVRATAVLAADGERIEVSALAGRAHVRLVLARR